MNAQIELKKVAPTESEILHILRKYGESTVQDVHSELAENHNVRCHFHTVFRLMQIMTKRGLLEREVCSRRNYVYRFAGAKD